MKEDSIVQSVKDILNKDNVNIEYNIEGKKVKIPMNFFIKFKDKPQIINDFIRIYTNILKLKQDIIEFLFEDNQYINATNIYNQMLRIESEENILELMPYIDINIDNLKNKIKELIPYLDINVSEINELKENVKQHYINNSYNDDNTIDNIYLNQVINDCNSNRRYSIIQRSRYGTMSKEYNLLNMEDIEDYNTEEIGGQYSPILVIYTPAKYVRGEYVLDDANYVYIKRQPLKALINQEGLAEKGRDGMGAITYIKLEHNLTNENLQDILAELYIYGNKNNKVYENIRLADINLCKNWLTADRMKKEFKELRYYHKNLTQKVREIYDSTGAYYTQISGKYIFNTREFLHCYKTFKSKDING